MKNVVLKSAFFAVVAIGIILINVQASQANELVDQMKEKGYTKCYSSTKEVWSFLINNNKSTWISTYNKKDINKFPWHTLAVKTQNEGDSIISLSILDTADGCEIHYVKSDFYSKGCAWVRENVIPKAKFKDEWSANSVIYNIDDMVFILTSVLGGAGCQVNKEEVLTLKK
jgi:hypothetical protein